MTDVTLNRIVILGGGTAGWMTAAALARFIGKKVSIILVESDAIGTVGVGEATIPHIQVFNDMLGIDEHIFMQATQATFKLGIRFEGWGKAESQYYHPFGDHGFSINNIPFQHYWLRARHEAEVFSFDQYSFANIMACNNRFAYPSADPDIVESTYSYAYHLNASAYAVFLRRYSEGLGVERIEGKVETVIKDEATGALQALRVDNGQFIEGDLFIDCSGFRARLIGDEMDVPYQSWKQWLRCDSAVAIPCELGDNIAPYTRSCAQKAGWCWHIPLQNRMGNGHVFCSDYCSENEAINVLKATLPGKALADPRVIRFEAGMREKSWEKNCIAIGLSSGFLEPLESTSIYLIQVSIYKLLELLPTGKNTRTDIAEYNRLVKNEYEKIRDFIILHYWLNQRSEPFWQYCADMPLPETLQEKIEVFRATAEVMEYESGLFMPPSWLAIYFGQGLIPEKIDPRVKGLSLESFMPTLRKMPDHLKHAAQKMPSHQQVLSAINNNSIVRVKPKMGMYGARR